MRALAATVVLVGTTAPFASGCGGIACPEGWVDVDLACEPSAETVKVYEGRVGTGFFGYAAFGEKVSDDGEPCAWEPTDLAPGEGFDIRVLNEAGERIESARVRVQEDGTWDLEVVPGRTYDFDVESSLEGKPVKVEEGTLRHVAVFFKTGC
jgi:hypothetical protein